MLKRYRVQVGLRIGAIAALAGLGAYLIAGPGLYTGAALAGLCILWLAISTVHYTEAAMRDMTRFLESVRYADFSQGFRAKGKGPVFEALSEAFETVTDEFRRVRAEREEQVRYLENIVQHLGMALIAYRDDGHVELMNTTTRRLLRTGPIRTIDALERVSPSLVEALRSLDSGEQAMVRVAEDDRTLQLAVRVSRFRLRGETHALASIQDLRNTLEEKEMEAWQQLTRVLTHEIMNSVAPISSLASTANRLLGEVPPAPNGADASEIAEDAREAVQTIERRSKGLISFVDSYRSFTKIPSPTFEMLAAQELFDNVRRLLRVPIDEHNLDLHIQVEPPDLQVTADPELIEQVLINLVLNAIQAVERQPDARIELRAHTDLRRSRPVLQVADNGPGIPPDVQEKIFVPFFTTKEDGSGIGLSLSRQIMRLHGGTISVRSTSEDGTVFTLRF